jgi:hypothetical protein
MGVNMWFITSTVKPKKPYFSQAQKSPQQRAFEKL